MKKDTFRDYVLEQLSQLDGLSWRPMFTGTGLYVDGIFFGIISDGCVYVRVDEVTRPQFEAAGATHFQPSPDFESKKYYELPAEVLDNTREVHIWVERAVRAKRQAELTKKARTCRRKSK